MSLLASISQSPAMLAVGAIGGALLGPAAAATSSTVPTRVWPWQLASMGWLLGEPASRRRRGLLSICGAVVLGTVAVVIGWRPALLGFLVMGMNGLMLAAVDLEHHRLPDRLIAPGAVVSGAALLFDAVLLGSWPSLMSALLCAVAAGGLLLAMALISPSGMGLGDVKLAALLSLHTGWLGWQLAALAVLAGFAVGAAAALLLLALRRATLRSPIPFGPALLLGAWLLVLAVGQFG
ncbi:MAG: A24 family peptidase [Actinomycetota bacterium]|nr:A24 family peptidase [Actinomycetota bacterium]